MNETEKQILAALKNLDEAVAGLRTASPKPDLKALFARIESLSAELPPGTDAQLRHYLARKSYEKARLWLEGRDSENRRGSCGNG